VLAPLDATNINHLFAFVGVARTSGLQGESVEVQILGEVIFAGWGLTLGQHYLAGANGSLLTSRTEELKFSKIVGYANTAESLVIQNFSPTIL